jgi:hypothetical protein
MKLSWFSVLFSVIAFGGVSCSSGPSGKDLSTSGPKVVDVNKNMATIKLDRNLKPERPEVYAEIKDFSSPVTDVRLKFVSIPMEIPMKHLVGTTWVAQLTPDQLQKLAIRGQTARYDAKVMAHDKTGKTGASDETITIAIVAPPPSIHRG